VLLRLDANGAWSVGQAAERIRDMAQWPVEALEEPSAEATGADLAELQALAEFPLALDESLAVRPPGQVAVRRQVLKPMVCGGPLAVAERAAAADAETVITTTVDAAVGVWAAVHAAAAVTGRAARARSAPGLAHGLGTSGWLAADLAAAPEVTEGRIRVPSAPGLGIRPRMPG
jgi:O-succinylbenzoate synthase